MNGKKAHAKDLADSIVKHYILPNGKPDFGVGLRKTVQDYKHRNMVFARRFLTDDVNEWLNDDRAVSNVDYFRDLYHGLHPEVIPETGELNWDAINIEKRYIEDWALQKGGQEMLDKIKQRNDSRVPEQYRDIIVPALNQYDDDMERLRPYWELDNDTSMLPALKSMRIKLLVMGDPEIYNALDRWDYGLPDFMKSQKKLRKLRSLLEPDYGEMAANNEARKINEKYLPGGEEREAFRLNEQEYQEQQRR